MVIYAFDTVLTEGRNPNLDLNMEPKRAAEFLMKRSHMKGKYLGQCLDSCRWGGQMGVMWDMSITQLVGFIENWMKQNNGVFEKLFHEKRIEEVYSKFELPYLKHKVCPRNKGHKFTVVDGAGRIRCAHTEKKALKPSYIFQSTSFDDLAQCKHTEYSELEPQEPSCGEGENEEDQDFLNADYDENYKQYAKEMEQYEAEKPTFKYNDSCYAILDDSKLILSLEKIIERVAGEKGEGTYDSHNRYETIFCGGFLPSGRGPCERLDELDEEDRRYAVQFNHCFGHKREKSKTEMSLDGWTLAFYVQKWYEQLPGKKMPLLYENNKNKN